MNVKRFLTGMLGLQAVTPKHIQIQQSEKTAILEAVNLARANVNHLPPIIWDYKLESDIKDFLPANRTWLFANSNEFKNTVDFKVNFNLMFLMRLPQFKDYKGYNYIFHDTCTFRAGNVLSIFKFRIRQAPCFEYNHCNKDKFTNFESCMRQPVLHESGQRCSWAWRYYVPMIREDLQSISCVRFSHPGPYTPRPEVQKDSFGCYGRLANATNDVPYKLKV